MDNVLIVISYLFIATVTWTKVYNMLYRNHLREFPTLEWDDSHRMFGIIWGGSVALAWPLAWLSYVVWWISKHIIMPFIKPYLGALERLEN